MADRPEPRRGKGYLNPDTKQKGRAHRDQYFGELSSIQLAQYVTERPLLADGLRCNPSTLAFGVISDLSDSVHPE